MAKVKANKDIDLIALNRASKRIFPAALRGRKAMYKDEASKSKAKAIQPLHTNVNLTAADHGDLRLDLNATVRVSAVTEQNGKNIRLYKDITVLELLKANDDAVAKGQKVQLQIGALSGRISNKQYEYDPRKKYSQEQLKARTQFLDQELLIRLCQLRLPILADNSDKPSLMPAAQELLNNFKLREKPVAVEAPNQPVAHVNRFHNVKIASAPVKEWLQRIPARQMAQTLTKLITSQRVKVKTDRAKRLFGQATATVIAKARPSIAKHLRTLGEIKNGVIARIRRTPEVDL